MRHSMSVAIGVLFLGASPTALLAQEEDVKTPPMQMDDADEIIVTGAPQRGSVMGDIKPEQQLSPADVRALGVSSVSELLSELSPQAGEAPVVLLNGKRISSFSEIRDLPTEAIARVDILAEQVALSYGYAPTQKVVNIVLRQRFRAETADLRGGTTTQGGGENGSVDTGLLRIRGDNRFTLNLKYSRAANLLESERDIIAATPEANAINAGDPRRYRTLNPATENFSANATLARALGGVSATLNARVELSDNDSLQGLPVMALTLPAGNPFSPFSDDVTLHRYFDDAGALGQRIRGTTGHLGLTLNGQIAQSWQWSFTGNADISDTRTTTDRGFASGTLQAALDAGDATVDPYGVIPDRLLSTRLTDSARARSQAVGGDLLLSGTLFDLPAGAATSAIKLGASANGFKGRSLRSGVATPSDYDRQIGSGQISIDLPLTSRSRDVLGAVGDIGVNLNVAAQQLSDFGTLSTVGYGLRWTPIPILRFLVSASQDRAAPTGQQINDPEISTPNVSLFDYARGETVFVTRITGGSGDLDESVRDQLRIGATLTPKLKKGNLTLTANYLRSRTDNLIAAFPTPTPAIEDAFPQRFIRDADGILLQVDARPINFLQSRSAQLRWGVDFSVPLKSNMQKKMEAWRAAGAKPEDRPADLRALFGDRRGPGEGGSQNEREPNGAERSSDSQERRGDGPGFGGGGGRPGGGGFGGRRGGQGGGQGGGRLMFSLYHTWHLEETILIAPGIPELDLLNGDATGSSGGQPRHEIEARAGYSNNGLGGRLSVNWESGTHVDGALGGTSRLNFGGLATASLRLFANVGQMPQLVKAHPFLRGARVSLSIDNLFNTRRHVTDATGATPLRYQPDYLDPLGRTITLSFRKLFF